MKIARLAGLMLIAIFAMSLAAASAASAAAPEFNPTSGVTITGTSGTSKLTANNGTEKVTCGSSQTTGSVVSATLAGGVVVHFLSCTATGTGGTGCTVNSAGQSGGLILTNTLHGILGLILPRSGTGVGLLLLPASGSVFVTLSATTCTKETKVTGNLIGEASPIAKKQTTGTLTFAVASTTKPAITLIDLSNTNSRVKAELEAFTTTAVEENTTSLTYSGTGVEVT
jgi:hypothetical protein